MPDITQLSARSFARLAAFVTDELGIKMPEAKLPMVQSRLIRRVRELGMESVEQYTKFFLESPDAAEERAHLINAITTNKTDFFREAVHFDYLTQTVLPACGEPAAYGVWSAGCSSGEEPYTLAMVLSEHAEKVRGFGFSVFATDVSTRVLERAKAAVYEESLTAPIPPAMRRKYLLRSKDAAIKQVRIVPELRQRVRFESLNFMRADYRLPEMFDAVFFRNVMIYFDRKTQEEVIRRICRYLRAGGYLFVGHSESLAGLDVPVAAVGAAIYRRK